MELYQSIARKIDAMRRCAAMNNTYWYDRHKVTVEDQVNEHMPSGSGFDAGTTLDFDESTSAKLVFLTEYHHMDGNGSYNGWTQHKVIVTASLAFDVNVEVEGEDRDDVHSYIADVFICALIEEVK